MAEPRLTPHPSLWPTSCNSRARTPSSFWPGLASKTPYLTVPSPNCLLCRSRRRRVQVIQRWEPFAHRRAARWPIREVRTLPSLLAEFIMCSIEVSGSPSAVVAAATNDSRFLASVASSFDTPPPLRFSVGPTASPLMRAGVCLVRWAAKACAVSRSRPLWPDNLSQDRRICPLGCRLCRMNSLVIRPRTIPTIVPRTSRRMYG